MSGISGVGGNRSRITSSSGAFGAAGAPQGNVQPELHTGSRGAEVKEMQTLLKAAGQTLTADGIFGNGTASALSRFQQGHGLTPTGKTDDATWDALRAAAAPRPAAPSPAPAPPPQITWAPAPAPAAAPARAPAPSAPAPAPSYSLSPLAPRPAAGAAPASRPIDLFPKDILWGVATGAPAGTPYGMPVAPKPGTPREFEALSGPAADKARKQYFGPTYAAITMPPRETTLREKIDATAALSALPGALLGSLATPAANKLYSISDRIPSEVRRPLEKHVGILIDTALSAANIVGDPILDSATRGASRPGSMDLKLQSYGQISMSCGETAAATILKSMGEPVPLGGIDTQLAAGGGSSLVASEFHRRGLSMVNGQSDPEQLKVLVAAGYPVMVNIVRPTGAMHYAVVTGFDDAKGTFTINNFKGGEKVDVKYKDFQEQWAGTGNHMTAVVPRRDPRLEKVLKSGDPKRADEIQKGLSISDFYVNKKGKVFVEGAYRYVTPKTDVTLRVNFSQSEEGLSRQLGGSLSIKQKLPGDWHVGLDIQKMSLKNQADDWTSISTMPVSVYGSVGRPGFELRAGAERGAFQASVAADLSGVLSNVGFRGNVAIDRDGSYRVFAGVGGTF